MGAHKVKVRGSSSESGGAASEKNKRGGGLPCWVRGRPPLRRKHGQETVKMPGNRPPTRRTQSHQDEGTAGVKVPVLGHGLESRNLLGWYDYSTVNKSSVQECIPLTPTTEVY